MSDWENVKLGIAGYYERLIDQHGVGPRACDYGRPESQRVKFRVLSEVMSLDGKSILDVGCGFADFADYLDEQFEGVRYSGVDITPGCIEKACRTHPGLDIRQGDILQQNVHESYDLVTANGIFYLMGDEAESLMKQLVTKMFELSRDAVAFNSLSSWCDDKEEGEYYADPSHVLEFCRGLTPWVTLRHDYHARDFTVYMYKKQNR